jgi:hypothetical protein
MSKLFDYQNEKKKQFIMDSLNKFLLRIFVSQFNSLKPTSNSEDLDPTINQFENVWDSTT